MLSAGEEPDAEIPPKVVHEFLKRVPIAVAGPPRAVRFADRSGGGRS
jgi:hypothetical protein